MNAKQSDSPERAVRRYRSLSTRLTWVSLLIITVSLFALGTVLIFIANRTQQDNIFRLQRQSAEQVSQLISNYMIGAVDRLHFFLKNDSLLAYSPEQQRNALENLLIFSLPLYSQVTLLDTKGNELIKISRFHTFLASELVNQAQTSAFAAAIKNQTYIGPVAFLGNTGLLSVRIALPIKPSPNAVMGVLFAEVNVSHLWQDVARINVGRSGYAYLVDKQGRFIAYHKPAEILQKYGEDMKRIPPAAAFVANHQHQRQRVQAYEGLFHDKVIGTCAPIAGTQWAVVVELPTREAYASIDEMKRYLSGLMLICVLLAGVFTLLVSRRLIEPIRTLTEAARRFGTGDLETEFIEVVRPDEVGVLTHAFKVMQTKLIQEIRRLKASQTALQNEP